MALTRIFLRYRKILAVFLFVTLFSILLVPSIQATERDKQNPNVRVKIQNTLERNQKIHTLAEAIQRISSSLDDAEKLEDAKQSVKQAWERVKDQFDTEQKNLEAANVPQLILDRYLHFTERYETTVNDIFSKLDAIQIHPEDALFKIQLKEELLDLLKKPYEAKIENPTPFRKSENRPLTVKQISQSSFPKQDFKNVSLEKSGKTENLEKPSAIESLSKITLNQVQNTPPQLQALSSYPQVLIDLAQSLENDPLQIFNYVYNNIDFIPYYGIKKGSYNTYLEHAGNDADTAVLLNDLLNIAGYSTRFVRGYVKLLPEQAKQWVGVDDPLNAGQILANGFIPVEVFAASEEVVYLQVEHTWLEVYIPYGDYRGALQSNTDFQWIPLDASLKSSYSSQLLNIPDQMGFHIQNFFEAYLRGEYPDKKPFEAFQYEVETYIASNYPDLTYEDFLTDVTFKEKIFDFLPNTLPFEVVQTIGTYTSLPAELNHKLQFKLSFEDSTLLDTTFDMQELANKQIVMSYEPATAADQQVIDQYGGIYQTPPYLVELKPIITFNSEKVATGNALDMGLSTDFELNFLIPDADEAGTITLYQREHIEKEMISGNDEAIAINSDRIVYPETFSEETASDEFLAGQKLYKTALNYLARLANHHEEIGTILGSNFTHAATRAIVFNGIDISYIDGVPQTFEWKGLRLDASSFINYFSYFGDNDTHRKEFMMLFGLEGSLDESSIFEEDFEIEAMSTVKGFRLINTGQIPGVTIYKIDASNLGLIDSFSLAESTKITIRDEVNAGKVVYTPDRSFTYLSWTGLVYLILDPETGNAGYIIGEGLNGGYTVADLLEWLTNGFYYFFTQLIEYIQYQITADIVSPTEGQIFTQNQYAQSDLIYTISFELAGTSYTIKYSEVGTLDTSHLGENSFKSSYGTNKSVKYIVQQDRQPIIDKFVEGIRAQAEKAGQYQDLDCLDMLLSEIREATGKSDGGWWVNKLNIGTDPKKHIPDTNVAGLMDGYFAATGIRVDFDYIFQPNYEDWQPGDLMIYDLGGGEWDDGQYNHSTGILYVESNGYRTWVYSTGIAEGSDGSGGTLKKVTEDDLRKDLKNWDYGEPPVTSIDVLENEVILEIQPNYPSFDDVYVYNDIDPETQEPVIVIGTGNFNSGKEEFHARWIDTTLFK